MKRFLELHDSVVERLVQEADSIVVKFDHAYVHVYEQILGGGYSGTGWSFKAELTISSPRVICTVRSWPFTIYDGDLKTPEIKTPEIIPIPFQTAALVLFQLSGTDKTDSLALIDIAGDGVSLQLVSEGRFIEKLPSDFSPEDT